jgi:hypothetical protein
MPTAIDPVARASASKDQFNDAFTHSAILSQEPQPQPGDSLINLRYIPKVLEILKPILKWAAPVSRNVIPDCKGANFHR